MKANHHENQETRKTGQGYIWKEYGNKSKDSQINKVNQCYSEKQLRGLRYSMRSPQLRWENHDKIKITKVICHLLHKSGLCEVKKTGVLLKVFNKICKNKTKLNCKQNGNLKLEEGIFSLQPDWVSRTLVAWRKIFPKLQCHSCSTEARSPVS